MMARSNDVINYALGTLAYAYLWLGSERLRPNTNATPRAINRILPTIVMPVKRSRSEPIGPIPVLGIPGVVVGDVYMPPSVYPSYKPLLLVAVCACAIGMNMAVAHNISPAIKPRKMFGIKYVIST